MVTLQLRRSNVCMHLVLHSYAIYAHVHPSVKFIYCSTFRSRTFTLRKHRLSLALRYLQIIYNGFKLDRAWPGFAGCSGSVGEDSSLPYCYLLGILKLINARNLLLASLLVVTALSRRRCDNERVLKSQLRASEVVKVDLDHEFHTAILDVCILDFRR